MFDRQIGDPDHVRHLPKLTPPPECFLPVLASEEVDSTFSFPTKKDSTTPTVMQKFC